MKLSALSISLLCILVAHFTSLNKHVYASSETCDFPAIFNFGDGNSDTGAFTTVLYGRAPFYGISYFGSGQSGRASDGRLMIDFMANSLGLPFLQAFLDSLGANYSHGANFANVLSTIAPPKLIIPARSPPRAFNPIYLDIQIAEFAQFVNRSQTIRQQGGFFKRLMPKKEYFSKALYTIDIGQNELSQGLFLNLTVDEIKDIIPDLINRISSNVKTLYSLGARTFWIHNTGPLGCLPYMFTMVPVPEDQHDSVGCAKPINDLSQYYNNILKKGVDQLRNDLPLAAFTYVDIYSAKYSLYQQPEKYGFKLPFVACCGYGGKYNFGETSNCGVTITRNGKQVAVGPCKHISERISWDGIQYSERADKITFDKISTGKYSDPPNSLKRACRKV